MRTYMTVAGTSATLALDYSPGPGSCVGVLCTNVGKNLVETNFSTTIISTVYATFASLGSIERVKRVRGYGARRGPC